MKRFICLMICLFLCSCQSKVTKYTSEEVEEYNLKTNYTSKANMKTVKQVNGDKIWIFQESYDRGLKWQLIDHPTMDPTSTYEINQLMNNYQVIVIDHYLSKRNDISEYFDVEYSYFDGYKFDIVFHKEYETRDDLKQACDTLQEFKDYVVEENRQYTDKDLEYEFHMTLNYKGHTFSIIDNFDYEEVDKCNLQYALIYQDTDLLKEYSNNERKEALDEVSKISIRTEDDEDWLQTNYYTYLNEKKISSTVLYDILQTLSLDELQIDGNRDQYSISINEEEIGSYQEEMISFEEAEKITGIQFNIDD